eukprot:g7416.t1
MSTDSNLLKSHQPWRRLKQESRYLNNTNAKPRRKKKKKNLEQKTVKRARSKILAASQRGTNYDLKRLFLSADKDKDEALSFNEWENILSKHRSGVSFSLDDVKSLFLLVNESKNGYISWKEFLNFVDPNAVVKQSSINHNSGEDKTFSADTNTKFASQNQSSFTQIAQSSTVNHIQLPPADQTSSPPQNSSASEIVEKIGGSDRNECQLEDEIKLLDKRLKKIGKNKSKGPPSNTKERKMIRKISSNGLLENPYRFHRKNTLLVTKRNDEGKMNAGNENHDDVSSSFLLQSVLALPENEIKIKDDRNDLLGLLGRARRLGGSNVTQADEDKNADKKKNADETTLNSRQRNLLLMTLSSPTNNNPSPGPFVSQKKSSSDNKDVANDNDDKSLHVSDNCIEDKGTTMLSVDHNLGQAEETRVEEKKQKLEEQQLVICDDNDVIRERAEASEVQYLKQQILERDNFIAELQEEKKVLMDRVRDLRLNTAKLRSTSSNPVGYLPGHSAMVGFTGRRGNVVENLKNVEDLEVELARSSTEIENLRFEVKRLQLVEREFDAKIQFVTDNLRLSTRDEITDLREQVKKLNGLLRQNNKSLQQEKVINRRNAEKIQMLTKVAGDTKSKAAIEPKNKLQKSRPISKSAYVSRKTALTPAIRSKSQSSYSSKYQEALKKRQQDAEDARRKKSKDSENKAGKIKNRKTFQGVMHGLEEVVKIKVQAEPEIQDGEIMQAQINDAVLRRKKSMEAYEKEVEQSKNGSKLSSTLVGRGIDQPLKPRKGQQSAIDDDTPSSPPPMPIVSSEDFDTETGEEDGTILNSSSEFNSVVNERGNSSDNIPPPPVPPLPTMSPPKIVLSETEESDSGNSTSSWNTDVDGGSDEGDDRMPSPPNIPPPGGPPPGVPPPMLSTD